MRGGGRKGRMRGFRSRSWSRKSWMGRCGCRQMSRRSARVPALGVALTAARGEARERRGEVLATEAVDAQHSAT